MATYKMEDIDLIVHIRGGGSFYRLTDIVTNVSWSGSIKSPYRELNFEFIQAVNDEKVKSIGLSANSTCCFYVGGKEIFRGNIIEVEKVSSNNGIRVTAYDIGYVLHKDEVSYNFVNKSASEIAKTVFAGKDGQMKLPVGKIAKGDSKITKMFIGVSRYETIMTAYTEHAKTSKKKYMIDVDIDKFNVIEKGEVKLKILFNEKQNVEYSSYKESVANVVNRVLVVDEQGNKLQVKTNKEFRKLYHTVSKVIEQKKDGKTEDIDAAFHGLDRTCDLHGYGDITCKSGYKVQVKDSYTGLIGDFYIDKDKHSWIGGKYSIDLELNFDNIMDEKSAGKDESKASSGEGKAIDWGHGITADMINKLLKGPLAGKGDLFIKYGNMYKVNPMMVALVARMECGEKFDSNLAVNHFNFFGIKDPDKNIKKYKSFGSYSSVEEGIRRGFHFIGISHVNKKGRKFDQIISTWAPVSDGNDTAGYIRQVKSWYKQHTGKDWTDSNLGTGVTSDEEADSRLISSSTSGSGGSGGNDRQRKILQVAESMVGKGRYTWGGKSIYNSDCSGFVYACHKAAGITIGGSTSAQLHNGKKIPSLAQALPGDLIITQSSASGSGRHVMLYIGNGMVIHNGGPEGSPITKTRVRRGSWTEIRRCW